MAPAGEDRFGVPNGVQRVLLRAAADPAFRADLMARRAEAARDAGIELTESEVQMLTAATEAQLSGIIAARGAGSADLAGGERPPGPVAPPAGIRPDEPPPRPDQVPAQQGIRPDEPPPPQRPEHAPVTRGIRPDLPWGSRGPAVAGGMRADHPPERPDHHLVVMGATADLDGPEGAGRRPLGLLALALLVLGAAIAVVVWLFVT